VFSPLSATLEKFTKRNEEAKESKNACNFRLYKNVIPSYVKYYRLSNNSKNSLSSCTRTEVEQIFDSIKHNLPLDKAESQLTIMFNDISKEKLDQLKNQFLPLELTGDALFITPVDDYDLIINTQILMPDQAGLEFLNHF
jgi:hypothetical protein